MRAAVLWATCSVVGLTACKTGDDRAPLIGSEPGVSTTGSTLPSTSGAPDPCAKPGRAGCPCDDVGATVECGKVIDKSGDYVTCSAGRSRCEGGTWSACEGTHYFVRSLPGSALAPPGLAPASTAVACTNACDPDCNSLATSGSDVDASGLLINEGGVSLAPSDAATGSDPCKGLWCQIQTCSGGAKTTLSGTVYDPAQKNPLYSAYVYIPVDPSAPLPPFTSGASCDTCAGANLSVVALTQTGADGKFQLANVPSGVNIPLVIQMGKWRRKVTLPSVLPCVDNAVDKSYTHLPRNRTDGDGNVADIPKMAIATGSADPFECLLLKTGIDPNEIQFPGTGARIDYYRFNGKDRSPGGAPSGSTLTSSAATLETYDAVLLPCEGQEVDSHATDVPNLVQYTAAGGRLFVTHFGYSWLATPSNGVAQNLSEYYGTANWKLEPRPGNYSPIEVTIDQSFPKGQAFAQWLFNVGASSTQGKLVIDEPRHDATSAINPPSQRWLYGWWFGTSTSGSPDSLMSMTFNTPVGAASDKQCGRVVYSDFHVSANALVSGGGACNTDTDCGFGATCSPPVYGTCSTAQCSSNFDCGGLTCKGAVAGKCQQASCSSSNPCDRGTCTGGICACSRGSQCASGSCDKTLGICNLPPSCVNDNDCGRSEMCSGATSGVCQKTCTTDADCGGTGLTCIAGLCQGCLTDNDCPGWGTTCNGGKPSSCSASSSMFPLACRNGDLSPDEKALEFMLFDLTACVSPDSYTPGLPTTTYSPVTFTQDFVADCSSGSDASTGKYPVWRELDWQASIPDTASIDFSVQSADTTAELGSAPNAKLPSVTTSTALPSWDGAILDGGPDAGVFRSLDPPIASGNILRLTITLNPTSDGKASPTLMQWKAQYDCADAE